MAVFAVILKDALDGSSPVIVYKGKPDKVWENGFEATIQTECNRLVDRMVLVLFDPYIKPSQLSADSIYGTSSITVEQKGKIFKKEFNLNNYGMRLLGDFEDGKWSSRGKYVGEYPAIGGFFCTNQVLSIRVDNLNFDPRGNDLTLQVERFFVH